VGFGFGPIQSGLFLLEAFQSGHFSRLVVSEIDESLVHAVRENGGTYWVNIARPNGIEAVCVTGVEMLNPMEAADRAKIVQALADADEIATALPSVRLFKDHSPSSVAGLLAASGRVAANGGAAVLYAAENHNRAAELLQDAVETASHGEFHKQVFAATGRSIEFLNTVIGKMSGLITDTQTINQLGLKEITPGISRAILVEEFNHILISRITTPGFERGIEVFEEKKELLPYEEAKLYGHNAIHALLGYLANLRGLKTMAELRGETDLLELGRTAFIQESGTALIRKYASLSEPLFSEPGYRAYAEDLLERMINPHLHDLVERIIRDPKRKLGWDDRFIGTMRLALGAGIEPVNMAAGAAAALAELLLRPTGREPALSAIVRERRPEFDEERVRQALDDCWSGAHPSAAEHEQIMRLLEDGWSRFIG
jgi:mannitol-1-phosphate 5-dehydrogenase